MPMAIEDALATWLGNQRWFAGKGQGLRDLAIVADTELVSGDPELRHLIVAVSHNTAVAYYQILIGLRGGAPPPAHPVAVPAAGHRRLDARRDQRQGPVRGRRRGERQHGGQSCPIP